MRTRRQLACTQAPANNSNIPSSKVVLIAMEGKRKSKVAKKRGAHFLRGMPTFGYKKRRSSTKTAYFPARSTEHPASVKRVLVANENPLAISPKASGLSRVMTDPPPLRPSLGDSP